jgi:hypothetical protein
MTEELHLSTPRWDLASDKYKVEIMQAYFDGKIIQVYTPLEEWDEDRSFNPSIYSTQFYRVKPKPEVVEVKLYTSNLYCGNWYHHTEQDLDDIAEITFILVDGEPDWTTLKGRKL